MPSRAKAKEPTIDRITISVPREMGQLIRLIAKDCDLDNSKLLRRGLDLFVKEHEKGIHRPILEEYWRLRKRYGE